MDSDGGNWKKGGTMEGRNRAEQLKDGEKALRLIREDGWRIAGAARFFSVTVPVIHEAAHCVKGAKCDGWGCRIHQGESKRLASLR